MEVFNVNHVKSNWTEIRREIQKAWGNLTGDELEKTQGNMESISGMIQRKYGPNEKQIKERLDGIYSRFAYKVDYTVDDNNPNLREE